MQPSIVEPLAGGHPTAPIAPCAFVYMDAMRAACAVAVAFSHVWALLIVDYSPSAGVVVGALYFLAGFGHAAVVLFFVLSGYWISRSVITRVDRGAWRWAQYLSDRLARLLVVLLPTLLIGGTLDYVAAEWLESTTFHGVTGSYALRAEHERTLSLGVLAGNLLFLQGLVVPPFGSNGPLWSLAYEFWFYLWFPAIWLFARTRGAGLGLLTLLAGAVYPQLLIGFATWACGAILFLLDRRGAVGLARSSWALPSTAVLLLAILTWQRLSGQWWIDPILGAAFAIFLLALLARMPAILPGISLVARFGANASFSLYATLFPIVVFVATLLLDQSRMAPGTGAIAVVIGTLILTVVLARGFAALTEANTGRLRALLRSARLPSSAGA